jgi:hypothetical protein
LRFASFAPFALLGFGSSSRGKEWKYCDWTREACGNIPVNSEKFERIAKSLWGEFEKGANGKGIKDEVFQKAFEMTSPHVICNFAKFPDSGEHPDTVDCCRDCGKWAADRAPWYRSINADDFEWAWCKTEEELKIRRDRAARLPGGSVPTGSGGGMGCG